MKKLQQILSSIEDNGVSKQDINNIEKEYGDIITSLEGVHINMFTKIVSNINKDVVIEAIKNKLKDLKASEDIINITSLTTDVMNFDDYISDIKLFLGNNEINFDAVVDSKNGYFLSYYNEEEEISSLGVLPLSEALVSKSDILVTINETSSFKVLLSDYENLEEKTSNTFKTLNEVVRFIENINANIALYENKFEQFKNRLKNLIVADNIEVKNEFNSIKPYLDLPKQKANLLVIKIVIALFSK